MAYIAQHFTENLSSADFTSGQFLQSDQNSVVSHRNSLSLYVNGKTPLDCPIMAVHPIKNVLPPQ